MVRIALLFPSSRKGEYEEGIWWYSGEDDLRKKIKYSRSMERATIFPNEERANKIIERVMKIYIPMNCPKFWLEKVKI